MLLPSEYLHVPASAIAAKLAHTCSNHFKASLTTCTFHPSTSRIVTGNKNGEMAFWDLHNGFKFVKQFTAHHMTRLTAMRWSNNEQYCITGDANGFVKYETLRARPRSSCFFFVPCIELLLKQYICCAIVVLSDVVGRLSGALQRLSVSFFSLRVSMTRPEAFICKLFQALSIYSLILWQVLEADVRSPSIGVGGPAVP